MKTSSAEALSSPAAVFMHNTQQFFFPGEMWEKEGGNQSNHFASFIIFFPKKSPRNYVEIYFFFLNIWAKAMTWIAESKKLRSVFLGQMKMNLPPYLSERGERSV